MDRENCLSMDYGNNLEVDMVTHRLDEILGHGEYCILEDGTLQFERGTKPPFSKEELDELNGIKEKLIELYNTK